MDTIKKLLASDVMVGDFVKLTKDYGIPADKIIQLTALEIYKIDQDDIEIEPIQLTEEILDKNSYNVYHGLEFIQYALDKINVIREVDEKFYYSGIQLKYVHELQHLIKFIKLDKQFEL